MSDMEGLNIVVSPNVPEYTIFAIGSMELVEAIAGYTPEQKLALANALVPDGVFVADPAGLLEQIGEYLAWAFDDNEEQMREHWNAIRAALGMAEGE